MRVVSARRLASASPDTTDGVDRHRAAESVVAALLLALCAGSLAALAPGVSLLAHLLVVLVAATTAFSLDRRAGLASALLGTLGAVAGALLVTASGTTRVLLEGVATLLTAGAVSVLVASARSHRPVVGRARSLDDAVVAFAAASGTGTLTDAVAAGLRTVVPSASLVRLQLGPFNGPLEELPDMVLATLVRTGERASLPDGFTRTTDAVLVGFPVVHGGTDAGAVVVRVPTELPDDDLDRIADLLARVAPTLAAHAAAAVWTDVDPTPAPTHDRDEVMARAAHDLRVPLTSLAGTAETLARHGETLESRQRRELYQVLTRSTRRVAHWVTALLEDSLSGGEVVAVPRDVELAPLLEESAEAARAATAGLDVRIEVGDEVVRADPGLVVRAVCNLLANAGHHAGAGDRVEITVHDRGDEVQVRVADHGPGFDPEVLASVSTDEKRWLGGGSGAGLGLGLASARALVAAWDGSFGIGRTPGGGATVWFTLPLATPVRAPVPAQGAEDGRRTGNPGGDPPVRDERPDHEPTGDRVRWTVVAADPSSIPGHLRR